MKFRILEWFYFHIYKRHHTAQMVFVHQKDKASPRASKESLDCYLLVLTVRHNMKVSYIRLFYLYEFKLSQNAAEKARNISKAFEDVTLKQRT